MLLYHTEVKTIVSELRAQHVNTEDGCQSRGPSLLHRDNTTIKIRLDDRSLSGPHSSAPALFFYMIVKNVV